jgi:integrase
MTCIKSLVTLAGRDPERPLPDEFELPTGFTCRRRQCRDGSISERLLYRAPEPLRPVRADGKRRLLSWSFRATLGGLAEGLEKQRRIEGQLRTVKVEADRKRSKLYVPTVAEAAEDYLADPDTRAMRSIADRRRHMRVMCKHVGAMLVSTVMHHELQPIIAAEHARGQSRASLVRLRAAMSRFFHYQLEHDKVSSVDFMRKVRVPSSAPRDERKRKLLKDDEFYALVECKLVPLRYRVLYWASRAVGGMRASDLHAWTWGMVDTEHWSTCLVVRPKTKTKPVGHRLQAEVAAMLKEWFLACGSPGPNTPVFPRQRPRRKGQGKKGSHMDYSGPSYARRLRTHLLLAGVTRAELHDDVPAVDGRGGSKRADFHSFRRLFCTAQARAKVPLAEAMRAAGHKDPRTHMRYMDEVEFCDYPAASMPQRPLKQP